MNLKFVVTVLSLLLIFSLNVESKKIEPHNFAVNSDNVTDFIDFSIKFGDKFEDNFRIKCTYDYLERKIFQVNVFTNKEEATKRVSHVGTHIKQDEHCLNEKENYFSENSICLNKLPSGIFNSVIEVEISNSQIYAKSKLSGFKWNETEPDMSIEEYSVMGFKIEDPDSEFMSKTYTVIEYNINRYNGNATQTLTTPKLNKKKKEWEPWLETTYYGKCKKYNSEEHRFWTIIKSYLPIRLF